MTGRDAVPPARSGLKLTYDDFLLFPDDGNRHELIDGEHYVTASPNLKHQQVLLNLTLLIGTWLEAHPIGRVFFAPLTSCSRMLMSSNQTFCTSRTRASPMSQPLSTFVELLSW